MVKLEEKLLKRSTTELCLKRVDKGKRVLAMKKPKDNINYHFCRKCALPVANTKGKR